jgi:Integrase core domain
MTNGKLSRHSSPLLLDFLSTSEVCRENGIIARNTKPRTPTTTGKIERLHQTLRRDLLDQVEVWPDIKTAQAAIDAFRAEYNTIRPHQSLGMAFPANRFVPRPVGERLPLRLPAALSAAMPASVPEPIAAAVSDPAAPAMPAPLMLSANGVDPVNLAVEFTRVVPASGNLTVCRQQQFWLGPDRAGATIAFWADTTVVHLLANGVRLKTVPSRLTAAHLQRLLAEGARPAGQPPIPTGQPDDPIEVDRLVSACGQVRLAGRQHPIGYHFAGRRVTVRLDGALLQLVDDGVLLRSLPNPLTPSELARIRDARPAGPPPQPAPEAVRVDRRVSCRGAIVVAGQRIHVGMVHAGRTLSVESADHTLRVYHGDELLAEVARTSTKPIARFKVRKPEPHRRPAASTSREGHC